MTPDRDNPTPADEPEHGVLGDSAGLDTTGIDILGAGTSHVDVSVPLGGDDLDDDLLDDDDDGGVLPDDDLVAPVSAAAEEVVETAELDPLPADPIVADAGEGVFTADIVIEVPADAETKHDEATDAVPEPSAEEAADAAPEPVVAAQPEPASAPEPAAAAPEPVSAVSRRASVERVAVHPPEVTLTSKRLDELSHADRESSDLLTPDRLLDPTQRVKPEPEGAWRQFVYALTGHRVNLGDGKRARARKALSARIAAPVTGGARFVPVLSRKGGVGKTTITTLLGMALADARDDRVIAVDANPDRGTLAERIARPSGKTVRDLVRVKDRIGGYNDISTIVTRDETRLDVLASDTDPHVSEAFSDADYREVADVAAHYYSIVLTDTGTGIVHSVMGATLDLADQIVIVAGLSVDEARLASETLTWLETNGYADQVERAIVVLNQASPGAPVVRLDEVEGHFRTRVRDVVRMPYDPQIATGAAITFRDLQPATRLAARELAAKVVEGLRVLPTAA